MPPPTVILSGTALVTRAAPFRDRVVAEVETSQKKVGNLRRAPCGESLNLSRRRDRNAHLSYHVLLVVLPGGLWTARRLGSEAGVQYRTHSDVERPRLWDHLERPDRGGALYRCRLSRHPLRRAACRP